MRARKLPAEERRRMILDAAVDVFARAGYESVGTSDIARAAGIGEPTIYRYFANKRELYLAAVERAGDEVMEAWEQLAAAAPDGLTALQRIGVWYVQRLQTHPELLLLRARAITGPQDDEIASAVRASYRRVLSFVEKLFARAQHDGLIGEDEDVSTYVWLYMAVGSLLDQAQMLDLKELSTEQVLKLAAMIQPPREAGPQ
jgi:AcrR family transcriptional regulator